jgi:hypothetical protein
MVLGFELINFSSKWGKLKYHAKKVLKFNSFPVFDVLNRKEKSSF